MANIELVIKISEEDYKAVSNKVTTIEEMFETVDGRVMRAIVKGTPLPKGHGDLKDQKDLAKSLYDYQWIDQPTYIEVTNRLINTPTIIEAGKAESEPQESEE